MCTYDTNGNVGRSDPQNTYDIVVQMARLAASRSAREILYVYVVSRVMGADMMFSVFAI